MKLQKHLAYKYKNKKYYKHVLTIPRNLLKELGWKPGETLKQSVENGKLVIKPTVQLSQLTAETDNLLVEKLEREKVNENGDSK